MTGRIDGTMRRREYGIKSGVEGCGIREGK
jgi:hypothetical protein